MARKKQSELTYNDVLFEYGPLYLSKHQRPEGREVNKLCRKCAKDCKQWAWNTVLSCAYTPLPKDMVAAE